MGIAFLKSRFIKSPAHIKNYIEYMERKNPLFSQFGELELADALGDALYPSNSTVWEQIFSLTAEDAERLNVDREYMKNLLNTQRNRIAAAYNISPNNLRIIASFHNADHHPHVHMLIYSTDRREGYVKVHKNASKSDVLNRASEKLKSILTNAIFSEERIRIEKVKAGQRDALREVLQKAIDVKPEIQKQLCALSKDLAAFSGRKNTYGYLPPQLKQAVDKLLENIISQDTTCAMAYESYAASQRALLQHYAKRSNTIEEKMSEWRHDFLHPPKDGDTSRHNIILRSALSLGPTKIETFAEPEKEKIEQLAEAAVNSLEVTEPYAAYDAKSCSFSGNKTVMNDGIDDMEDDIITEADLKKSIKLLKGIVRKRNFYVSLSKARKAMADVTLAPKIRKAAYQYVMFYAQAENPYAQYHIGKDYLEGIYFEEPNLLKAEYWLSSAAKLKNEYATYALGKLYLDEEFEHYNPEKAADWFEKCSFEPAYYLLGKIYHSGLGRPQSDWYAIHYYMKCTGKIRGLAQYKIAKIYESQEKFTAAAECYHQSALAGHTLGMYEFAKVCLHGIGCPVDYNEAYHFFSKLSIPPKKREDFSKLCRSEQLEQIIRSWSLFYLAKMTLYGYGTERNYHAALELFEKAVEEGNPFAQEAAQQAIMEHYIYKAKSSFAVTCTLVRRLVKNMSQSTSQNRAMGLTRYQKLRRAMRRQNGRHHEPLYP